MQKKETSTAVLVVTAAVLLAIWPFPNTMALRHLMLLCGSIASVFILVKNVGRLTQLNAWPVWVFFAFFLWLVFHLLFLAGNFEEQWREFTSDWLRSFLAACMGLALGLALSNPTQLFPPRLRGVQDSLLIWGLAGTVTIFCIRYAYEVMHTGQWIHLNFYMTPYLGKTPLVIFGSLFLPTMFIRILMARQKAVAPIWYLYSLAGLAGTILMYYFANTKNGFAVFVLLSGYFLLQVLKPSAHSKSHRNGFYVLLFICLVIFGYAVKKHLDTNPAWSNLIADYKISQQIEKHSNWKDRVSPLPLNEHGIPVDGSTYERVSWGHAGLELLKEHPWGYGQINHSFGALAIQKWSDFHKPDGNNRGATHSGWLDFALGFGIAGLLLVWIPLCASYVRARKRSDFWGSYAVWAIPVIAISYLITEVSTGHFIELLFFMTALFSGLTLPTKHETTCVRAG